MSWQLTADRPIYLQLIEEIELRIVSGMYTVGEKASRGAGSGSASVGQPKHDAEGFNGAGAAGAGIFPADRRQVYNGGQQDDSKFKKTSWLRIRFWIFLKKMNQLGFTKEETNKS